MTLLFKSVVITKHLPAKEKDVLSPAAGFKRPHLILIRSYCEKTEKVKRLDLNKKQDEGALDNYLEVPLLWQIIKITIEDVSSYANKAQKRVLLFIVQYPELLQYSIFSRSKILMASNDGTEDLDRSQEPQGWTYVLTHFEPDRVGCF